MNKETHPNRINVSVQECGICGPYEIKADGSVDVSDCFHETADFLTQENSPIQETPQPTDCPHCGGYWSHIAKSDGVQCPMVKKITDAARRFGENISKWDRQKAIEFALFALKTAALNCCHDEHSPREACSKKQPFFPTSGEDLEIRQMQTHEILRDIEALPDYETLSRDSGERSACDDGYRNVGFDTSELKAFAAEVKKALSGSNYTADDDTFPTEVTFANGRKVGIAFDGDKPYLTVGSAK